MIIVTVTGTVDNADVLAGTDLANIPSAGVLIVRAASTVIDTLLTITGPGNEPVTRNTPMILRANAEVREREDPSYQMATSQGGRYVINVDVGGAATFRIIATWASVEDLAG